MRFSVALLCLQAAMAMASPVKMAKKDYVYDILTDILWVTVTADPVVEVATSTAAALVVVTDASTVVETAAPVTAIATPQPIVAGLPFYWSQPEIFSSSVVEAPAATSEVPTTFSVAKQTTPIAPFVYVTSTAAPSTTEAPAPAPPSTTEAPVAVATSTSETPAPVTVITSTADAVAASSTFAAYSTVAAATSSVSDDASAATSTDLVTASLYHHNIHRSNHSAPALGWNDTLAAYSATVASSCVYAHDLTPGGGGYGQNIAVYGESGDVVESLGEAHQVAQASTDMWYNGEIDLFLPEYYGQANPDFTNFDSWGHFSQMVWLATEEVGCASQYCDAGTIFPEFGSWFTVCNYGPEGNMGGEYGANILEPLGQESVIAAV